MSYSHKPSDDVYRLPSDTPEDGYLRNEYNPDAAAHRDYSKPKGQNSGNKLSMIVLGVLVLFSFVLGFGLVYIGTKYLPETLKKMTGISEPAAKSAASGDRKIKVVLIDQNYKLYNGQNDKWEYHSEKELPLNTYVKTNFASARNLFTLNDRHSIRANRNTTFAAESFAEGIQPKNGGATDTEKAKDITLTGTKKPATPLKTAVKNPDEIVLALEEGNLWVESGGDLLSVRTSQGLVLGRGDNFEVKTLTGGGVLVYSWGGPLDFKMKSDNSIKHLEAKQILLIGGKGNIKKAPIAKKDRWQEWNQKFDTKKMLAGSIPETPPYELPTTGTKPVRPAVTPRHRSTYQAPRYTPAATPYVYQTPRYIYRTTTRPTRSYPTLGGSDPYPKATGSYSSYPTATPRYYRRSPRRRRRTPSYYRTRTPSTYSAPGSTYRTRPTPTYRNRTETYNYNNSSIPPSLRNPSSTSGGNPLYNKPTATTLPGMGINDKPVGPAGGYGVPYYGSSPAPR